MGLWENQFLPRCINFLLGTKEVRRLREDAVAGLQGSVVEIGFGSGLNVPFYPSEITTVYAIDPSSVGRQLASKRVNMSSIPVQYVGLDGQRLPLADESVDAALSTFTLCTIPDVGLALSELHRVLRPGGQVHFLEHGLAPDPAIASKQHRFNRFQQRVGGGCNLDRPIDRLVWDAGFEMSDLRNDWMGGPKFLKPWNYLYQGVAIKPSR
jgi:ubiquinone/menaquinone biosynthesis C-methylase UbiE